MSVSDWLELAERTTGSRRQTMAEYGVVLAVNTIGAVGVFTLLAGGITNSLSKVTVLLP